MKPPDPWWRARVPVLAVSGSLDDFCSLKAGQGRGAEKLLALCDKHQVVMVWSMWLSSSAMSSMALGLQSLKEEMQAFQQVQQK